jgi:hypothetical protein
MTEALGELDLSLYYTAKQAAEEISNRSKKQVRVSYLRVLASYGKLHPQKDRRFGNDNFYPKAEVDSYVVEDRGVKVGAASRERALENDQTLPDPVRQARQRRRKPITQ